ncbi:hypothetical protein ACWIGM_16765 [Bosea sp. NPDC055332]
MTFAQRFHGRPASEPNPGGLHNLIVETVSTTTRALHAMRVCENGVAKVKASGIISFAAQPDPAGTTENEIRPGRNMLTKRPGRRRIRRIESIVVPGKGCRA